MLVKNPSHAILFLNLGGPETLADVKPFLRRLFEDPEIIRVKFSPLRMLIAWFISTTRKKKSQELYKTIGGGSPIRRLTDAQSKGVQRILTEKGKNVSVRTAFTCSHPLVEDVVKELGSTGVKHFLAFPLYPQYSCTTTKGSLDRSKRAVQKYVPGASFHTIQSWPVHPLFLKAHAQLVRSLVPQFSDPKDEYIHLLFSAHSIPEKLVTDEGDPYKMEIEQTVKGVLEASDWKGPWTLAWQSKLGPVKWLEPFTGQVIRDLGRRGEKQILVVPIAFVTDHVETLNEIDILFLEEAQKAGVREFRRTPGLNDHPTFLQALAELALGRREFWNVD